MRYKVSLEEILCMSFEFEASSRENALSEVVKRYNEGKIVLCPGELQCRKISVTEDEQEAEWIEF